MMITTQAVRFGATTGFLVFAALMITLPSAVQSQPTSQPTSTGSAAAGLRSSLPLSDVGRANQVRSLIEQAVKSNNAGQASKLMEEASQLLKLIGDPKARELAAYMFDAKDVNLDHLLKPKTSMKTEKVTVLTDKLKLVERGNRKGYPFVGMVDNGKGFIIPVPHESDELQEQDLQLDGKSIYSVKRPKPWKMFNASGDSRMVALSDWMYDAPIEVLDVSTGKTVPVPEPKGIEDHYYMYAFKFLKWADDSKSFLVTVEGTAASPGKFMAYREVWKVDAITGKATRSSHAEKPWAEKLTWDDPTSSSSPSK